MFNELLPNHALDDGESYGSLAFNEILDEQVRSQRGFLRFIHEIEGL